MLTDVNLWISWVMFEVDTVSCRLWPCRRGAKMKCKKVRKDTVLWSCVIKISIYKAVINLWMVGGFQGW